MEFCKAYGIKIRGWGIYVLELHKHGEGVVVDVLYEYVTTNRNTSLIRESRARSMGCMYSNLVSGLLL